MPDPFLFIVAIIAIVTIVLFPIRLWQRRRRRYGTDESGGGDVPLAPDD
ncbi:MAG: hypothetical protein ACR2K4_04650 [Candidatus Limnocylindria bacterium]